MFYGLGGALTGLEPVIPALRRPVIVGDISIFTATCSELVLRERVAGDFLGAAFVRGDIDYKNGVIALEKAESTP
jgi:hypothetical protein